MGTKLAVPPGTRFGDYTVLEEVEGPLEPSGKRRRTMRCQCHCGAIRLAKLHHLRSGDVLGCENCRGERLSRIAQARKRKPGRSRREIAAELKWMRRRPDTVGSLNRREQRATIKGDLKFGRSSPVDTLEQRKERFVQAIHQALVVNSYTQRELCDKLSLTIGSLSKYIAKKVDPLDVKLRIQTALADSLGVTVDSLNAFYLSGKFHTAVTLSDVQEFIRQSATAGELPTLLKDVADLSARLSGQSAPPEPDSKKHEPPLKLYSEGEAKQLSEQAMAYFRECAQVEMLSPKEAWQRLKEFAQAEGMTAEQIERFREVVSGWDAWSAEEVNALAPYGEFGAPGRALRRLSGGGDVEVLAVPGSGGAVVTVQSDP